MERNNISFLKRLKYWITTNERLDTNYWPVQDWKDISTRFSIIKKTLLWEAWNIVDHGVATLALKSSKLKVHDSLKENELVCFTNSKGSFQVFSLVRYFWKKKYLLQQYEVHVSSPWQSMHVQKSLSKQGIQKRLCTTILLALKNYLHVYLRFL